MYLVDDAHDIAIGSSLVPILGLYYNIIGDLGIILYAIIRMNGLKYCYVFSISCDL